MKIVVVLMAFGLATACTTLPQSGTVARTIVVDGEAFLSVAPDTVSVSASLITRNPDQSAGLSELSAKLAEIRQTLPRLAGLTQIEISSSEIRLAPVFESQCMAAAGYDSLPDCPIIGRIGVVGIQIKASPADRAGYLISMLSQVGASSIELGAFSLEDHKAQKDKAIAAAMEDARSKAISIAAAAGTTIAGLEKVQYGGGFGSESMSHFSLSAIWNEDQQLAGAVVPTVDLDVAPTPIEIRAKVVASFLVN